MSRMVAVAGSRAQKVVHVGKPPRVGPLLKWTGGERIHPVDLHILQGGAGCVNSIQEGDGFRSFSGNQNAGPRVNEIEYGGGRQVADLGRGHRGPLGHSLSLSVGCYIKDAAH